ncbi:MAG: hypothetical protein IPK81_21425 [Rhodospirillales bacterium]|nr:MAG: hypothetical protein IPK81_21425 [Rhodospirillales bacterium]
MGVGVAAGAAGRAGGVTVTDPTRAGGSPGLGRVAGAGGGAAVAVAGTGGGVIAGAAAIAVGGGVVAARPGEVGIVL